MPSTESSRATMRDVARLAGVSLKSVSRVVNDEAGVSPALRERVAAAVAELDYRHNLAASNLRRGRRTGSVGVLVQDVANDFCAHLLRAVELRAREYGVVVIAASIDDDEARERALVDNLVARRIDGLVLMPSSHDQGYLRRDRDAGLAVVLVDRRPEGSFLDAVTVDNRVGARTAVEHLYAHGHRRIAFIGDEFTIMTAAARRAGYRDVLGAHGIAIDPDLERVATTREDGRGMAELLLALDDPPTAVFAARNAIAEGVAQALQRRGLAHRVGLVGFDDVSMGDLLEPGLTVVRQDLATIGTAAFDLLLSRLEDAAGAPRHEVVATQLVQRGSGEIRPPHPAGVV